MDYVCVTTVECNQGAVRAIRYNGKLSLEWIHFINNTYVTDKCNVFKFSIVDGNYCLSCGSDKKIKLWNPLKGLLLNTYAGHGNEVLDAASSCDNRFEYIMHFSKTIM